MSEMIKITVPGMPPANQTYSQAIQVQDFIFLAGQIGMDFEKGILVNEDITAQTKQLLENTQRILEAAGSSLDEIVRVMIFITDIHELGKMNEVFAQYIRNQPAKTVAVVSALYGGAKVEMEFTAISSNSRIDK